MRSVLRGGLPQIASRVTMFIAYKIYTHTYKCATPTRLYSTRQRSLMLRLLSYWSILSIHSIFLFFSSKLVVESSLRWGKHTYQHWLVTRDLWVSGTQPRACIEWSLPLGPRACMWTFTIAPVFLFLLLSPLSSLSFSSTKTVDPRYDKFEYYPVITHENSSCRIRGGHIHGFTALTHLLDQMHCG